MINGTPLSTQAELSNFELNVPLLAIKAANELDELMVGRSSGLTAVEQLTGRLDRSFPVTSTDQNSFVDSETVAVFSEAISGIEEVKTIEDLVARTREIAGNLKIVNVVLAKNDQEQLRKLRAYCLALASAAASFRNSVYEARPQHPFEA
jgi:hypothetical protein